MILIPCGGNQCRWDRPFPKHLAPLPTGNTVLERLIHQCLHYHIRPRVYARDSHILQVAEDRKARPEPLQVACPTLTEWLITTSHTWTGRTVILLGDVVFSPEAFRMVMQDKRALVFFGNACEIFAFSFLAVMNDAIVDWLRIANTYAQQHREDGGAGKLWSLYKAFYRWPQEKEVKELWEPHWGLIEDWTKDMDYGHEYDAMCAFLEGK